MTAHWPARLLTVLGLLAALHGCAPAAGGGPSAAPSPAAALPAASPTAATGLGDLSALPPEELVDSFYRWYIGQSGAPLTDGTLASSGYLSEGYAVRLSEIVAGFDRGAVDPLLCAQDLPTRFTAQRVRVDAERAVVHVTTGFPGQLLEVHLARTGGQWRIDQVYCGEREAPFRPTLLPQPTLTRVPSAGGSAQDSLTTGWPVYVNDSYGFRFSLPPDWAFAEYRADPGLPPLGPRNVRLLVHVMPQEWAARAAEPGGLGVTPFVVEVTVGTLEQFRDANLEPARSEALQVGDLTAVWEEEALTDLLSLRRYVFQHPEKGDLRVTFHDPISGFPERLAAAGALVDQFKAIVGTMAFTP
ncbi:MAG: DUF3828 domain-containing protein [Chloroflexi bacterium]|nr:DUF3828 domain-containing protein [Chloroflexota bacterium]